MAKVLVSDPLSDEGIKILKKGTGIEVDVKTDLKPDELKEIIKDYEGLIVRSATKVTKDIIAAAKKLKIIGRAGVGLDNVDLDAATQRGIIVMNTPGGNTMSTAEHTMSMIMALARSIPQACSSLKGGEWKRSKFLGVELYGKTLGIVGFGRIGTEVAKRAIAFGMKVIAYDPFIKLKVVEDLGIQVMELNEVLKKADFLTIHTPLSEATKHMISDEQFEMMKKGVRIINCARGGIVDEVALEKAIKAGKVAGAALDVFEFEPPPKDYPLCNMQNVIVTPHLGASTEEAQVNVAIEIAEAVKDALTGGGIRNAANFPSVEPEVLKALEPYINMVEKLGLFSGQLVEGRINKINISYNGEISNQETKPLTMSLIKGALTPIVGETVNFINAVSLAKERGIQVQELKSTQEEEFANLVSIEFVTDKESLVVCGTLFSNKKPRIVKINEYYVEAIPQGYMLVGYNWDKPGIIGAIGTLLGKDKINIAGMTFGREKKSGKAIMVLNIDSPASAELLEQIRKLENILGVKQVKA